MGRLRQIIHKGRAYLGMMIAIMAAGLGQPVSVHADTGAVWHIQAGATNADFARMTRRFYPASVTVHPGDAIEFSMPSPEPHTVTLNPPQGAFVFGLLTPFGGQTLSGADTTLNSGQLNLGGAFTLKIANTVAPGTYRYACVLHPGMTGTISVVPADQALPKTDAQEQAEAYAQLTVDLAQAIEIGVQSAVAAAHATDIGGAGIEAAVGGGEQNSASLRYFPSSSTIHVGDRVTFVNRDPFATHSVTFGVPTPFIFFPYGDPTIRDPNQQVNSGVLASAALLTYFNAPNPPLAPNMQFTATFAAPGTYPYVCVFHDDMGMVASLTVLP